jgi:hypothetical protein
LSTCKSIHEYYNTDVLRKILDFEKLRVRISAKVIVYTGSYDDEIHYQEKNEIMTKDNYKNYFFVINGTNPVCLTLINYVSI